METHTILNKPTNMYKVDDFQELGNLNISDLNNKLFCTFTTLEGLDGLLDHITSSYSIMYNKIFVLHIKSNNEYVCTYNIDQGNSSSSLDQNQLPLNTIMVHRKKDTNTLYTINALNELIKKLNGGVVDTKFPIDWKHYKNCVLLTQHDELKQLNTKIHKIIEV
jgi:hypothetical protein|tara:strand:- start:192 stop:683 length:492 start_codon:yes stop_codon:yes gene_type:complete